MFDPTAFDNLRTVAEGAVYDWDLDGDILVTAREDLVDLAAMSRTFTISFVLRGEQKTNITARLLLRNSARSWAGEVLETPFFTPSCELTLQFAFATAEPGAYADDVEQTLRAIWGQERIIRQTISYEYKKQAVSYDNAVTLLLQQALTEEHAEDLPAVAEHMVASLHALHTVLEK